MKKRYSCTALLLILSGLALGISEDKSALPDAFKRADLLWEISLGTHQYTIPRIDDGKIYLGINDRNLEHPAVQSSGGGIVLCLDQQTGNMIWQLPIPRYMEGTRPPFHFNHWKCGVCSSPALDEKCLYIVGPRGDVLCLDRNGQADGNQGPFVNDAEYIGVPPDSEYTLSSKDGDILWQFDMIGQLHVVPHDVCGSSPLLLDDYLYICTSNGIDDKHKEIANPEAPALIVLEKKTGKLAAYEKEGICHRLLHGHWSSPVSAQIQDRTIVLFGGGDGILYAFHPVKNSGDTPQPLEKLWQVDCNPPEYRSRNGQEIPYSRWNQKSPGGPSEIIATPAVHEGRIYIAIGQSPLHGSGQGMLLCIDAASGDVIWKTSEVDRSLSNALIHEDLLYVCDYSGIFHCLNAQTGDTVWTHDLESGVWSASPILANDKILISTENQLLWIFAAGSEKKVLSRSKIESMAITPVANGQILYFPTQKNLFALKMNF